MYPQKENKMQHILFGKEQWNGDELLVCYTFRYQETPDFAQREDHIGNEVNPEHKEGFDNISLVTKETYTAGVKASLRCAFEGLGCPEIILVPEVEACPDGAVRYGACFEIVLYRNGVNIWRHYMDEEHRCSWHKRLGVQIPVAESEQHTLCAEVKENGLEFSVDGWKTFLRVDDLPERFHIGMTMCEGLVRLYEWTVGA